MSRGGAWRIESGEHGYPGWLGDLGERAPEHLYGIGERTALTTLRHDAAVTLVGSRRASSYGLRVAEELGRDLAAAGVTVISGMAWGIDSAAHRGALAGGGPTIAVMPGGADVVYPPSARDLYGRIAASGALISERPPGTRPERWSFPVRNRIMAALASLVIVVEAAEPSGTLVTVDEAAALGREVCAVPGQVGVTSAAGANRLLYEGAGMIRSAEDALDRLAGVGGRIRRPEGPELEPGLARVLALVEAGAATADAVALGAGLEPHLAAVAMTRLELLGYLRRGRVGAYTRTAQPAPAPGSDGAVA